MSLISGDDGRVWTEVAAARLQFQALVTYRKYMNYYFWPNYGAFEIDNMTLISGLIVSITE